MGNGKSTTGNQLIKNIEGGQLKEQPFVAKKSTVEVTSEVKELIFKDITFIDTLGFNDSDKKRTDAEIFSLITNHVN